jgi:hypothetical protein
MLLSGCQGIVGHLKHDFDYDAHLSCIFLYVTVVLWRHKTLYPKSPIGIMVQAIQDQEQWFIIRSSFHPQDAFGSHVEAY